MDHESFETPVRATDSDLRGSLRHVLASTEESHRSERRGGYDSPAQSLRERQRAGIESQARQEGRIDAESPNNEDAPQYTATSTTTRRNANGSVSSVYSGNKIRYLKKDDGQPLWRKDIQFAFLRMVFEDTHRVFTKASDGTFGHTFAEIYTDAMAKSSKCSQILKEKLLNDHGAAIDMAMICLLVNVGRMNTTLNFFPEMRARVRTYHSIPCLQAHQSSNAYKQLQDGPRLKSILKGATEDIGQPSTIEDIMRHVKPRTNPVNLIFVLSQYAPKISEMHFPQPRDFFDLFTRSTLSSKTRADAFLWLIWWYLESDFSADAAQANPFGRGTVDPDSARHVMVPRLDVLNEEEADAENVDTEEEVAFGEAKRLEREAIVANDIPSASSVPKRGHKLTMLEQQHNYHVRGSPYGGTSASDSEGDGHQASRSPSRRHKHAAEGHHNADSHNPGSSPLRFASKAGTSARINTLLYEDTPTMSSSARKGIGRGKWPRKPKDSPTFESAPPQASSMHQLRPISIAPHNHPFAPDPNLAHISPNGVFSPATNGPPLGYFVASMNESGVQLPALAPAPDPSGKRIRPPTVQQRAAVNERQRRINNLLNRNIYALQKEKRRERSHRSIVVDAWMKCAALPDGWNSEDDEDNRWGGIDNINARDDASDDVGERSSTISRGLRRIARLLDGQQPLSFAKRKRKRFVERDPTPIYEIPEPKPQASRRSRPSAIAAPAHIDSDSAIHPDDAATPPPAIKKKRIYKKRTPGAAPRATGPGSRGGRVRGTGGRAGRVGEVGIPVDEFLAAAAPPPPPKSRGQRGGDADGEGDGDGEGEGGRDNTPAEGEEDDGKMEMEDMGDREDEDLDRILLDVAASADEEDEEHADRARMSYQDSVDDGYEDDMARLNSMTDDGLGDED